MALATELIAENEDLADEADSLRTRVADLEVELGQEQAGRKAAELQLSRLGKKGCQDRRAACHSAGAERVPGSTYTHASCATGVLQTSCKLSSSRLSGLRKRLRRQGPVQPLPSPSYRGPWET